MCPCHCYLCMILFNLLQLCLRTRRAEAVKGCVTYVTGDNYSMRQSICDKPDTHFQVIPFALPSQVVKLTINNQEIHRLNASQFKHLPNLTYLDLDSNNLASIEPDTFSGLRLLRTLSLRFNLLKFIPQSFHPDVMHGFIQLEHLNLYHNPITFVPKNLFKPVGSTLRTLVLGGSSQGFVLDEGSLDGLVKLESLDLSSNYLETLPESMEKSFLQMNLKELFIYENPWKCDCYLRWLKIWFLSRNPDLIFFRYLPEGISHDVHSTSLHIWTERNYLTPESQGIMIQPKCTSPFSLYGRPLFDQPDSSDIQALRPTDFYCVPQAMTSNKPVQITEAINASIVCEFFADPSGIVSWYKNGTRIEPNSNRYFLSQGQGRHFHAFINISYVQQTDAGLYTCVLDTSHGRVNSSFEVFVGPFDYSLGRYFPSNALFWANGLDTTMVLKFTGIAASCLVILLISIGALIYCFCGRSTQKCKRTVNIDEKSTRNTVKINGNNLSHHTDTERRIPRSNLVKKHYLTTSEASPNEICVIQSPQDMENYVALRVLPSEKPSNCAVHNIAFIHQLDPSSLVMADADRLATLLGQSRTPCLPVSTETNFMVNAQLATESKADPTMLQDQPCPLHGTMYATLQPSRNKQTFIEAKQHLATIPVGLQSGSGKRINHTLPSRKKQNLCSNDAQIHSPEESQQSSFKG